MMKVAERRGRGRPPKPESERVATVNFTMRIRPAVLEDVRVAAEKDQRTVTSEAERRLSQPVINDIGKVVGRLIDEIEIQTGKRALEDETVRRRCRAAVDLAANILLGDALDERVLRRAIEDKIDRLKEDNKINRNPLFGGKPRSKEKEAEFQSTLKTLQEEIDQLQQWQDALKQADAILDKIAKEA